MGCLTLADAEVWGDKALQVHPSNELKPGNKPKGGLSPERLALCGSGEAQAFRLIIGLRPDWEKLLTNRLFG